MSENTVYTSLHVPDVKGCYPSVQTYEGKSGNFATVDFNFPSIRSGVCIFFNSLDDVETFVKRLSDNLEGRKNKEARKREEALCPK